MAIVVTVLLLGLFSALGSIILSRMFEWKNRSPMTGAVIGGVSGVMPILLLIVVVVVFFSPKLKEGARGYYQSPEKNKSNEANSKIRTLEERIAKLEAAGAES